MSEFEINDRKNDKQPPMKSAQIRVTPTFINSVLKTEAELSGGTFNQEAADAALLRFSNKEEFGIEEHNKYIEYYKEEVERRNGITFDSFERQLEYEINEKSRNSWSEGHSYLAKQACEASDVDIKDGLLNSSEQVRALAHFNQELNSVRTDVKAFSELFSNLNPDYNKLLANESADEGFENAKSYVFFGEENNNDPINLKFALASASRAYNNKLQYVQNITVNGQFDQESMQTSRSCHAHAYVNSLASTDRGREYIESLIKVDDEGSVHVFLPGNQKQYHYTKEDLFARRWTSSEGDYDMTAVICAIEDARRESGQIEGDVWDKFIPMINANLGPDKLLLNYSNMENPPSIVVEEIQPEEIIFERLSAKQLFNNFREYKNSNKKLYNPEFFKNDLFEVTEIKYDSDKRVDYAVVKLQNGRTMNVYAPDFEKLLDKYEDYSHNKIFIESFETEKNKENQQSTLFFNDYYTVIDVKNYNEITVKLNTGEQKIVNEAELNDLHLEWKELEKQRQIREKKQNDFNNMQTSLRNGDECFVLCVSIHQNVNDIDGKPLSQRHSMAIVDFVDMEHIEIKDSNCPWEPRFVTYDELQNGRIERVRIPEPVEWEIER